VSLDIPIQYNKLYVILIIIISIISYNVINEGLIEKKIVRNTYIQSIIIIIKF